MCDMKLCRNVSFRIVLIIAYFLCYWFAGQVLAYKTAQASLLARQVSASLVHGLVLLAEELVDSRLVWFRAPKISIILVWGFHGYGHFRVTSWSEA